jgi:hypothetical protein
MAWPLGWVPVSEGERGHVPIDILILRQSTYGLDAATVGFAGQVWGDLHRAEKGIAGRDRLWRLHITPHTEAELRCIQDLQSATTSAFD